MYRALLVCNSHYPDDPSALAELHGPKVDGFLLRDTLSRHDIGMFDKNDVRVLNDGDSLEVGRAVEDFFADAEADDILLFYFSGHGRSQYQQLFLCTRNTVVARLQSTAISQSTLNGIVSSSYAQVKILILDCCYSGQFKGNEFAEDFSGKGRYVIAATSATDRASDAKLQGMPSPFTFAFSEGLISKAEDHDGDGSVDLDDIFSYLASVQFESSQPQRNFDGSGTIPLARRPKRHQAVDAATAGGIVAINHEPKKTDFGYLENLARDAQFNSEKVSEFRIGMREDIATSMPRQLTSTEFLQRAGLLQQGGLTYAGLLLFGDNPTAVLPSAMVQCVQFFGNAKTDPFTIIDIYGTVPEMIVRARDFVADHARLGTTPTAEGAYAEMTYRYPMIAIREVIANAIVHRDYEDHESCVQILVFTDRIEVTSPGEWGGTPAVTEGESALSELERSSRRRNFRLARTLTWSRLVEGVGSGIPRALADCRAMGAPEPVVAVDNRMVTVTIFPRSPRDVQLDDQPSLAVARLALAQLPASLAEFTGREAELKIMAELLDPTTNEGPVVVSAIAGLAGVGKTALVVQAAHLAQKRGWYDGGVLFIDLHGYDETPIEPMQALDTLLRALGVTTEHIPANLEERAALYRSVLANISDPVLVIVDDASSEAQVRPLIPGAGRHRIMITSRHTLAGLAARLVDVAVLDTASAIALLDGALRAARPYDDRISNDWKAASELADLCGRLPLALQIVAAILKAEPTRSLAELVSDLTTERDRLTRLQYNEGTFSVAQAFELSYRRLDESSARIFRMLSLNPGPDVSTGAAAVLADLPIGETQKMLASLARAHLVELASNRANRWQMHALLRLYAQRLSEISVDADDREHARDRLFEHYMRIAQAADQRLRILPGMSVTNEFADRSDALAWFDAEALSLLGTIRIASDTGRDQIALRLPIFLAEYLNWRRRFDDMLVTSTVSLSTARRVGSKRDEGVALTVMGNALREMRRFEESIVVHQDALVICRGTGDRHAEGIALVNLGNVLREVRRFEEAITAHQETVAIFRETGDRHAEGQAVGNLGNVLREVRRFEEAITAHQETVAIFRETGDRHAEGIALVNLGSALQEVRRFEEAITAHQDAVAIFRETGDRLGEGQAVGNLGVALQEVRRFEEAITAHQDAVAIFRETGDRHAGGIALVNLGNVLREVRRFEEAITAHQDAVAIFRDVGDLYAGAQALGNLGVALQEVRRFEEAITAHQDAVAIFREFGDRHAEAIAIDNLGAALREVRRFEEAITAHQDAVAMFRDVGDLYAGAQALGNLGVALQEVRRFEEAITAHQDAVAMFRDVGDLYAGAQALGNLGVALQEVRRFEEAITANQDARAIFHQTGDRLGEAQALDNLGVALQEVRRFEEAITAHQDAVAIFREAGDSRAEGIALVNLGNALQEVRRFEEAMAALQVSVAVMRKAARPDEGKAVTVEDSPADQQVRSTELSS